jgi:hypothetical protein
MAEELFDYGDERAAPRRRDNLFLWTIFILLLIGVTFACWLGSFYIFGHPEEPRPYAILKKMNKLEPPRRFDVTQAPQGEFLSPQKVFERYSAYTRLELQRENAELLRIYIRNYTETKKLVPYLRGNFEVMDIYALEEGDMFSQGTVALLQAVDYPQIVVEHLYPATGHNLETSKQLLIPGGPFNIERTNDVTAILKISSLADGRMLLTVMPLHYPSYGQKGGVGTFSTEPPADIHVAAGLPISKPERIEEALKRYAQLRSAQPAPREGAAEKAAEAPSLVRLDNVPQGTTAPETGAIPEPPIARAEPVRPADGVPMPLPRATPPPLAMNRATPPAAATPVPTGRAVPLEPAVENPPLATNATPPAPAVSPSGVPLKPFNAAPVQSNRGIVPQPEVGGGWRVYSAGSQPRGRVVTPSEAPSLVDQPLAGTTYLSGDFIVTAKGENQAVLRPRGGGPPMRVIAEFPNTALPPGEGMVVTRDASRGFEIRGMNRGDDGTINVFVREITREP